MVISNAEFQRQFTAATKRGEARLAQQPVATGVSYNPRLRKIVIELNNGCTLLVPPELAQGLSGASSRELAAGRILGPGTSVEWPKLDVQLSVSGLLTGTFGTAAWMAGQARPGTTSDSRADKKGKPQKPTKANLPKRSR
jgi:hypothetical protein